MSLGVKATSVLIGSGVVMLALFAGVHQAMRSEKDQKLTASSESKIKVDTVTGSFTIAGVTIETAAEDEVGRIEAGFLKDADDLETAADPSYDDAWEDFVSALKHFAGDGSLNEEEARKFLVKLDEMDGEDNQLETKERQAWKKAGWGDLGSITATAGTGNYVLSSSVPGVSSSGVTIEEPALDEFAQIVGKFMEYAVNRKDSWGDLGEALTKFGGASLDETEAQSLLTAINAWDDKGVADPSEPNDRLTDNRRNAWQSAGWAAKPQ